MEITYALIKDNTVQNIIVADAAFAAMIALEWQEVVLLNKLDGTIIRSSIGWDWDGKTFTPPEPAAPVTPK